jgi:hypothetical protein
VALKLLMLDFSPEDGGSVFLRIDVCIQVHFALQPRRESCLIS